jgi:hypothetical protein
MFQLSQIERRKIKKIGYYFVGTVGFIAGLLGISQYVEEHRYVPPTPSPSAIASSTLTLTPSPTRPPTLTPSPTITITPSPIPTLGVRLISMTTTRAVGDDASISIQTLPGEMCVIEFKTPSGNVSESKELNPIVADGSGVCTWTWHISGNIAPGSGEVSVRVGNIVQVYPIEIMGK